MRMHECLQFMCILILLRSTNSFKFALSGHFLSSFLSVKLMQAEPHHVHSYLLCVCEGSSKDSLNQGD